MDSDPVNLDNVKHEVHSESLAHEPLPPWFGREPARGPTATELAEWAKHLQSARNRVVPRAP